MTPLTASEALMASRIATAITVDLIALSALSGRGRVGPWCGEVLSARAATAWSAYVIHDAGLTTVHCVAIRCVVGSGPCQGGQGRPPPRRLREPRRQHAGSW